MTATVTIRSKYGGAKIDALYRTAGKRAVKVGVLEGAGIHPNANGATVAMIAAWNEFGTSRIPERPFLRMTLREHDYYRGDFKKALKLVLRGSSAYKLLATIGVKAARDVQHKIRVNDFRSNSERTIQRKTTSSGVKDKPLIDTGHLLQSINSRVE